MAKIKIKYPEIPQNNISPELYNYFVQLRQCIMTLENALNELSVR